MPRAIFSKGVTVTIANLGQLVLPVTVQVNFADGSNTRMKLPVETWLTSGTHAFTLAAGQPVTSVVLDPDHVLPDNDRSNDTLTKKELKPRKTAGKG